MIFDPYPPTVGSFLLLSVGKFCKFLTPPPLQNENVLNGWSLRAEFYQKTSLKTKKNGSRKVGEKYAYKLLRGCMLMNFRGGPPFEGLNVDEFYRQTPF